jgi:hypothetical protein
MFYQHNTRVVTASGWQSAVSVTISPTWFSSWQVPQLPLKKHNGRKSSLKSKKKTAFIPNFQQLS